MFSVFVAEWWNTWSSLPIAALGMVAVVWSRRIPWRQTKRFLAGAIVLTIVGWGSAAFHGTLLRVGQALDELPMVYAGLTFLYIVLARHDSGLEPMQSRLRAWRFALVLFAVAFTAGYFFLQRGFIFFVLAYSALVATLVVRTGQISWREGRGPTRSVRRKLFWLSSGSYVGGVLLLWIPEHVLLPCSHPAQALHLHAWFHLTSAVGSYSWMLWAAYDRALLIDELKGVSGVGWIPAPRHSSTPPS